MKILHLIPAGGEKEGKRSNKKKHGLYNVLFLQGPQEEVINFCYLAEYSAILLL